MALSPQRGDSSSPTSAGILKTETLLNLQLASSLPEGILSSTEVESEDSQSYYSPRKEGDTHSPREIQISIHDGIVQETRMVVKQDE